MKRLLVGLLVASVIAVTSVSAQQPVALRAFALPGLCTAETAGLCADEWQESMAVNETKRAEFPLGGPSRLSEGKAAPASSRPAPGHSMQGH
jgi:hypothetical protein